MTVYDYDTGDMLDGEASDELIAESQDAEPTGAVPAVLRGGVWEYVRPSDRNHPMYDGEDVLTVYVMD